VAALGPAAEAEYYADQKSVARLLGVPERLLPGSWADFQAFFADVVSGDGLVVDAVAREIAEAVLQPPGGGANARLVRLLSAALLPERLRRAYGLDWGPEKEARFAGLAASARRLRESARPLDDEMDPR
jgi:uncharacterized protein (DUF2236 family)